VPCQGIQPVVSTASPTRAPIERKNGVGQTDAEALCRETGIAEERAADGVTVPRRVFDVGEQDATQARFFTADHGGSAREVAGTTGALLAH
jgi:hypothetical protein